MEKLKSLTIFFPCFNDSRSIPYLVLKAYKIGKKVASKLEVMVIDDGSSDDSQEILTLLQRDFPELKVYKHEKNLGYGATLRDGFEKAKCEWIFYTDGDGQYDPEELELLAVKATDSVDIVNGYKIYRSDSILRKIVGFLYNRLSHLEFPLPIRDVQCDFRLMRRSVLNKIHLMTTSGAICLSLIVRLAHVKARFVEVGVHHYLRPFGTSQFFRPKNLLRTFYEHVLFFFEQKRIYSGKK